ncbi:solute carrier family 2 member 9, like 1 isoform X2 [Cynoglossus semilaevis]|nr:solute carrier family 2, facilitated glucose transporter member 9-like isoform X2 [Cynoglossus semilaevis]XP_024915702.1 solute carrier family 2, facilitated glucose transporter member 9-like isoform X2 [Cynoglossus semilaevis]
MIWSLTVSMFAIGGLVGAISVKFISGKLGRKKTMIFNSLVAIIAAVIMLFSKLARSYEMLILARFLYGSCTGLSASIHILYLTEISPRKIRGTVTLTLGTFGSLGKLLGQLLGLSEILGREQLWNVLLCIPLFFSLVNAVALPFFPEAPRYLLIEKGKIEECKKALQSLWGPGDYKEEIGDMLAEQAAMEAAPPKTPLQLIRNRNVRWQLITMAFIYGCNQLSGSSAINNFSYDIFVQVGIHSDNIRYIILGLGATEILSSVLSGVLLIERTGRKPMITGGYAIMTICWVLVTVTLNLTNPSSWVPYITASLIILFIVAFSGGCLTVSATLSSELFVQSDRVAALVISGTQRWLTMALIGLVFPFILTYMKSYSFVFFASICLVGFLYTFFLLPETKEKTILQIAEEFKAITVCGKSFAERKRMETKL